MDEVYKLPKIAFPEVTGSTVSFYSEYAGLPLKKCEVAFAATQSGTGDPSPENIRPIIGVDDVSVADSAADQEYYPVNKLIPIPAFQDGEGDPSPYNVRQILYGLSITRDDDSELEVYGGTLNVFSGELTVTHVRDVFNLDDNIGNVDILGDYRRRAYNLSYACVANDTQLCNYAPYSSSYSAQNTHFLCLMSNNISRFYLILPDTVTELSNIEVVYPLATPEVIQLSATELQRAKDALGIATATIDLDRRRYGGTVDLVSGLMKLTYVLKPVLKDDVMLAGIGDIFYVNEFFYISNDIVSTRSNILKRASNQQGTQDAKNNLNDFEFCCTNGSGVQRRLFIKDSTHSTLNSFKAWLDDNPINILVKLAEPFTVQLTPAQIETIQGNNTIFADTGDTTVQYIRVY